MMATAAALAHALAPAARRAPPRVYHLVSGGEDDEGEGGAEGCGAGGGEAAEGTAKAQAAAEAAGVEELVMHATLTEASIDASTAASAVAQPSSAAAAAQSMHGVCYRLLMATRRAVGPTAAATTSLYGSDGPLGYSRDQRSAAVGRVAGSKRPRDDGE